MSVFSIGTSLLVYLLYWKPSLISEHLELPEYLHSKVVAHASDKDSGDDSRSMGDIGIDASALPGWKIG